MEWEIYELLKGAILRIYCVLILTGMEIFYAVKLAFWYKMNKFSLFEI